LLRDEVRLRQEAIDLARSSDQQFVVVGQLVDSEDGDDVLQFAVALKGCLDLRARRSAPVPTSAIRFALWRPAVHRRVQAF